jgi:hypothetical protein
LWNGFRSGIEFGWGLHGSVHGAVGGIMGTYNSPKDPVFFLHHTFIDKIWADWQTISPAHVTAYSGSATTAMPGMGSVKPADVLDLSNHYSTNGNIRICYVNVSLWQWIDWALVPLSMAQLQAIPRTPIASAMPWLMNMNMTNEEMAEVRQAEAIRNGQLGGQFHIISQDEALKTRGVASMVGLKFSDDMLGHLDGRIDLQGCMDEPAVAAQLDQCPTQPQPAPAAAAATASKQRQPGQ